MADSSFFTDGGSDSGTFQTIETKIAEAEAAKVAAQAAQAAAEQAESGVQASASQAEAAKDAAELAQAGATGSEANSASSATTAGNHVADAQKLAVNPEDSQYTLSDGSTTGYSALHYNEKAGDSAVAAAADAATAVTKAGEASASAGTASTDATTATTKAGEASASATAALQSEQNASQSETNAGQSETNSGQSETNAAASANTATTQAGIATTQAGIATTQAGTATTQAATATTKAGEASNSASSAAAAQTAAESARDSALSALDNFEDQYLGDHSSDPTTDGDGDPLAAGMIYYNTTDSVVKVYSGSAWVVAYADGTTLVAKSGDTMTGNLTVNANIDANSLNVDSGTLVVNGSTNRVGINLGSGVNPTVPLNVAGTVRFQSTSGSGQTLEFTNYSSYSRLYRSNGHLEFQGGNTGNGILQLSNSGGFTFDGNNVWHAGNLDSILDLGITDGSNGQALKTDGAGNLSFGDVATSTAWADITNKPTTISGFGITDAFDGAYSSLTGTPTIPTNNNQLTNGAGYITSADGGNAATLDGIDSSSFLRGDAASSLTSYTNRLTIPSNTTLESTSAYQAGLEVYQGTSGEDAFMSFHVAGDHAFYFGLDGASNDLAVGGWSKGANKYKVWHAGNDGSGSGLDADTVDGIQASNFLRSDTSDTMAGNLTLDNSTGSSTLSVRGSGAGMAKIWARGSNQATGMVMVSQDDNHGGGIEYNGDNSPSTTGAGADYIALFRVASGTYSWTARNAYSNNDWQFRGNVTAYASDERLKENIETIPNALDKVCQLRGVTFDWKDDCEDKGFIPTMKHETGVLAQNVASVIPDGVVPAPFDDEYLTVKHEKIIPVLIEAIKELKAEIEELKKG